jgi:hypothetical protein
LEARVGIEPTHKGFADLPDQFSGFGRCSWLGEMLTLAGFMQIADQAALPLPDYSFAKNAIAVRQAKTAAPLNLDSTETRKFIEEFGDWPPSKVLGLLALAQHHGVKTRLLDWSRRANVAAYLAASGGARTRENTGQLDILLRAGLKGGLQRHFSSIYAQIRLAPSSLPVT